jgi:pyruvate dehydrogenase E2 component (dihydrolipoamide acetyltransferase)
MPDLGEGVHEAEILLVPVQPGQAVKEGDLILEVETDKAAVEIPSPFTGIIESIEVNQGDTVKVGDILITFQEKGAGEKSTPAPLPAQLEQAGPEDAEDVAGRQKRSTIPVPASPATRRLARELGVQLDQVTPSGKGGLVSADDVRRHAEKKTETEDESFRPKPSPSEQPEAPEALPLPDFSQWGEIEKQPFRSIRRATANRMATSWARIPHVNCQDVADITKLEEFRRRHKDEIVAAGGRLTMTVFALKAVATALKQYPRFNASLDLEAQEIIIKKYFHIGIAVDTEHGLMVPVIRDVDRKSIKELSIELYQAIDRAKNRKSSREELVGGTFTITNAGAIGGGFFSAIVNHPEIAILGLGQGRMQPAVVTNSHGRDEIVPRLIMPVVLCFDHRVVDGADAIRFQRLIIDALEDPDELLITMT